MAACRENGATAKELTQKLGATSSEVSLALLDLFRAGRVKQNFDEGYDPALPYETMKWKAAEGAGAPVIGRDQEARSFLLALSLPARAEHDFRAILESVGALELMSAYTQYVKSAKQEILMLSPFIDRFALYPLVEALKVNQRLRARILTEPKTLGEVMSFISPYHDRVEAKALGATLKAEDTTKPLGLHMKSVIIDSRAAIVGSFNLVERHLHINFDCAMIFEGEAEVGQFIRIFEGLWCLADRV